MEGPNFVKIDQFERIQGATLILGEKHYPVYKGINTVGRNKIAVINIKHLNVSQNQAIIVIVDNNQHFISDLNSSNGTFLHNSKLVPFKLYELTNKADIKFGDVKGIYNKVTENDTTVRLQENLEMTQNMTQNFYASNTQLVIDTSTSNQPDEHNYSTISLQRKQQQDVIEDIHDMATQVEEYPPQHTPRVNFAIPVAKPMGITPKGNEISDIHDAPTQVISFPNCSSEQNIENVAGNIEVMEATQVMNYPEKFNIQTITETTCAQGQDETAIKHIVIDQTETQAAEKSNSSSEVSSERTQIVSSEEPANMTDQINIMSHSHQKILTHNSQVPSISGLRNIENCEIEDSFTDMKNMGTQGVIDETHIQPDDGSNDSLDFFTMNKINHAENKEENNISGSNSNAEDVPIMKNDTVNPEPVQKSGSGLMKKSSTESGSETDIEDSEDIPKNKLNDEIESTQDIGPRRKPLKKIESEDDTDSTSEICYKKKPLKKLVSDEIESTQDIGPRKKPLKRLESDDDTDSTSDICYKKKSLKKLVSDDTDSTQEICREKKPSQKFESDDDIESTEDLPRKKKPLKKLDSDNLDIDLSPSKKQKLDCISTNIDEDCDSDSETDCEDEIVNKEIEAFDNNKQGFQAKCNDSDTDIEDNEEEQARSIAQKTLDRLEQSIQLKDSSNLEESGFNDTDCIPATQDAFAEAFSYRSSKSQTNDNNSSEEESFKLGITQLMEDGSENKVEEPSENKQENTAISIPVNTEDIRQVNEVTRNDNLFLEPTEKIIIAKNKTPKPSETPEDPNSSKNDEIYIMSTQKINTEQNIQTGFKVPEKKFTFRKKTAILEKSLTTILSNDIEDDVYMAATQQIGVSVPQKPENDGSVFERVTQKLNAEKDEDDDVFLQPTQCFNVGTEKHSEVFKDDDVYSLSTQQIHVQSSHNETDAEEKRDEGDMYMMETQILPENPNDASKLKTESSEKISSDKNKEILADPPIIMNDKSIISDEMQSEMHFSEEHHSRPGNPVIRVLNKELLIVEVGSGASNHPDKSEMNISSSRSKFIKKSDIKNLQEKIKADMEKDDAETLSQIEAFVKKPLEVEERKEAVEKDDSETLSQIEAFIKKPLDANDSRVRRSVSDQETIRTDDVNQSFALLETKTSKIRRQPKKDMSIDDIKVTVTSHRRSMSVAETSMKEALDESSRIARKSRRGNVNNNVETSGTTRGKRKSERTKENKVLESDSEAEVPAKMSRRNSVTKKSSTDTATKRSSRVIRKIADQNVIEIIHEESSSSSNSRETSNNNENKAYSDQNVISSVGDDKVLTVNLKRKRISRLQSTESAGKASKNSDECESALNVDSNTKNQNSRSRENDVDNKSSTPPKKRISRLKVQSEVSTPTKSNRPVSEESLLGSAERSKRKQRPKVVFTMLDNPQLESYIKHLGGSVVDGVDACTVLVTKEVKRSQKLLAAVAQGKPICSPNWIKDSKKSNEFLDPWDFILIDKEAEAKWNFSLRESLDRANCKKLLTTYTFQLMVSKAADVLKGAIEASGGKCVSRNPGKNYEGHFVVVSSPENKSKYLKLKKQNPDLTIIEPEAIFDGVLRQELRFSKYLLT